MSGSLNTFVQLYFTQSLKQPCKSSFLDEEAGARSSSDSLGRHDQHVLQQVPRCWSHVPPRHLQRVLRAQARHMDLASVTLASFIHWWHTFNNSNICEKDFKIM